MLLLSPRKRNATAAVDCTPTVSIGSLNNNNSSQQPTSKKSNLTYNNKMRRSKSAPPSSAPSFAQDIRPQSPASEKKNDYMRGYALRKAIFFNKWKSEYFVAKKYKLCWYKSEKSYMKNKKPRGSFVYKNSIAEMVVAVNHHDNTTNNSSKTTGTGSGGGDSGGGNSGGDSSPRINVNNQFQFISGSGKMILLQCETCEEAYKWVTVLRKMIDSVNSGRKLTLEPCEPLAVPDADLTSSSSSSSSMSSSISTSFKRIRRGTTSLGKITMNTLTHTLTELTTATTTAAEDTASSSTCSSATVDCISPAVSPRTMEVMEQQDESSPSSSSSCSIINPNNDAIMVKNTTEVIVIPSIVMPSGPDSARSPPPAASESNATMPLQPITIVVSSAAADDQVVPPDNSSSSTTTTAPRVDPQFGIAISMSEKDKEDLSYLSRILSSSPTSSSTTTDDDAIPSPFSSNSHDKKNKKNKKEKKIDYAVDEYRGDELEMDHLSTDTQRNKNRSTSLCNAITMTNHHYSFAGREQVQQLGLSIPPRTNHSLNQMIMNQQQQEQQQQQQEQKKQPSKKKKKRVL